MESLDKDSPFSSTTYYDQGFKVSKQHCGKMWGGMLFHSQTHQNSSQEDKEQCIPSPELPNEIMIHSELSFKR